MPTPEELGVEWERYRKYYETQRLEAGIPSIFEAYWSGHVTANAQHRGLRVDPATTNWIQDPTMTRYFSKEMAFKRIVDEISVCHSCQLAQSRTKTVPGQGPLRAELMFVGEAPGKDEDDTGLAFVGTSGREYFETLLPNPQWFGMDRNSVFIGNTLKCRPPNNRDPKPEEAAACRHFLHRQIMLVNPKVMIALGKHAAAWLSQDLDVNRPFMGDVHGKVMWYHHIPFMVSPHPAAYVRDRNRWGKPVFETMQWVKWILTQPWSADFWERK